MTFDDFCILYVVFKDLKDEEMMQVVFHLIKLSPQHLSRKTFDNHDSPPSVQTQNGKTTDNYHDIFMKQDLSWLCRILSLPEKVIREYYIMTQF